MKGILIWTPFNKIILITMVSQPSWSAGTAARRIVISWGPFRTAQKWILSQALEKLWIIFKLSLIGDRQLLLRTTGRRQRSLWWVALPPMKVWEATYTSLMWARRWNNSPIRNLQPLWYWHNGKKVNGTNNKRKIVSYIKFKIY